MKEYIKPDSLIVDIECSKVLANSGRMGKSSESADPGLEVMQGSDRSSLWGDD